MYKPIQEYFLEEKKLNLLEWEEAFFLWDIDDDYVAQGIIHVWDDMILHTVHKKDKKSILILFKHWKKFKYIDKFVLPAEATHLSDLTVYNWDLYWIDYHSNFIYRFDLNELVNNFKIKLLKRIYTWVKNSGSLEIIEKKDKTYLLVTSFLDDKNMYVFDFDKIFENDIEPEKSLMCSINNSFFVQWLYYSNDRKTLFQSVNRFWNDVIYEVDFDKLLKIKNINWAIVKSFVWPWRMIEDIVVKWDHIYTSDEWTNKLYYANINSAKLLRKSSIYDFKNIEYYDKLLSHRARVAFFQENTLDAFTEVLKTWVKYIEMDIRFSKDDECYLYHDSFFNDWWNNFRIADNNKEYINKIKYSEINTPITKLVDLLKVFSRNKKKWQILAIDIKDFWYEDELYRMFEKYKILDSIIIFTWTPQTIFKFDEIFNSGKKSFPLYLSHVRTDSLFKYLWIPFILWLFRKFIVIKDFVLIWNNTYKKNLWQYSKWFRHVPYFTKLPLDLAEILKKYNWWICVTRKFTFKDSLLKKYHKMWLKVTLFWAIFWLIKIKDRRTFLNEAKKYYVDIVFVDDIESIVT